MRLRGLLLGMCVAALPLNAGAVSLLTNGTAEKVLIPDDGTPVPIILTIADTGGAVTAVDLRIPNNVPGIGIVPQDVRVGVVDPGTGGITIETLPSPAQLPEFMPDPNPTFNPPNRDRSTESGLLAFILEYFPATTFVGDEAFLGFATTDIAFFGISGDFDFALMLVAGTTRGAQLTLRSGLVDLGGPGEPMQLQGGQVIAEVIPEPGTLVLLGAALAGLSLLGRRWRV